MIIVSLHGLNNLRRLQYDLNMNDLSKIHQQLQTASSSLISEVNFTYDHGHNSDYDYACWRDIDTLMANKFSALAIVTIEWRTQSWLKVTCDHSILQSIAALPQLHKKGILRPLLPPPEYLK